MRHKAYPGCTPVIMKHWLTQHWGSVHHTVFYSTDVELECQEELCKMYGKNRTKNTKKQNTHKTAGSKLPKIDKKKTPW